MPTELIPLVTSLEQQSDKIGMTNYNKAQIDGYFDKGVGPQGQPVFMWVKRPGLSLFSNLAENTKVDGLHFWQRQALALATCNGKTYKMTAAGTKTDISGTATMVASVRPTYTDVLGTDVYQASGGKIGKFSTTTGAYLTDPQAPTTVTHVAAINSILVALNANSERYDWSDAGDPTAWSGLFTSAEYSPDLAKGLYQANKELYLPGDNSLEIHYDDGASFVPESRSIERGIIAPNSFTLVNGVPYWLDSNIEAVRMEGRIPVVISPDWNRYIRSFGTVSDATGDYVKVAGKNFWVLSFPIAGKTLVYDLDLQIWQEWGYYNPVYGEYEAFMGNCYTHANPWLKTLVGSRTTGKVYELSPTVTTDDGGPIRSMLRTDFIDRGTRGRRKFCHELIFYLKRANTAGTPNNLLLRWRDDGKTEFSPAIEVPVEVQSGTDLIARVRVLGSYYMRQWEIVMDDPNVSALVAIEERFDYGN
jgi:hypothetical protein